VTPGRIIPALIGAILLAVVVDAAAAYPKPAAVPTRWELDFKPGPLRLYVDPVDRRAYWYLSYTVTNRTRDDQIWAPTMVLFTDAGEILPSGEGVAARVEESIRELLGNALLETQNEVIGDLYQGREHEKDGLAVWPASNTSVNEMALFVGGLSGETARVRNPVTGDELILRKTLQRNYLVRGDALPRGSRPIEMVSQEWVMR
jgi:hypothetical protein